MRWRERGRGTATGACPGACPGGNGDRLADPSGRRVFRSHLNPAGWHRVTGDFASAFVDRAGDLSHAA